MKIGKKCKIVVVMNQKGGPGKTTISFHLAHAGVRTLRSRVACIDLDSQGNLSQYLTGDLDIKKRAAGGAGHLFDGTEPSELPFEETSHPQIQLLHGHERLDGYDSSEDAWERAYSSEMAVGLRALPYDFLIIDTPPAVGLRQIAPLAWADLVVIPLEPVMSGITGFQDVLQIVEESISNRNPGLRWVTLMNRANMSVRSHREKDQWMRDTYGAHVVATLGTRTAVADAIEQSPAVPVWQFRNAAAKLREQWRSVAVDILAK